MKVDLHYLYAVIICLKVEVLGNFLRKPQEDYMVSCFDIISSLIYDRKCGVEIFYCHNSFSFKSV